MDPSSSRPKQNTRNERKPPASRPPVSKPTSSAKLRGNPREPENVRISKTLSWTLRHGAKSEGLHMRPDGYVKVEDLLALPKLSSLNFDQLEKLVQSDAKQRYRLVAEPASDGEAGAKVWWIRANQGHSLKDVDLQHTEVTDANQIPMAVHGTTLTAWKSIATQGLSKMTRQHIHLAQGLPGNSVISGMRKSSEVLIYIDLERALKAGLKFYLSHNGVVLTPGDERGFLAPEFFSKVETTNGKPVPGWTAPQHKESNDMTDTLEDRVEDLTISENSSSPTQRVSVDGPIQLDGALQP